jgi:cation diffusion facilitator CzcD-associated flavoprotein CzcO
MSSSARTEFDVVVVGAGLSGVAAAHYLRTECPNESFVLLEGRDAIGGTWDLFRYPGVRSDSDMFTLGYSFRPWASDQSIAHGPAIRDYVHATAQAEGVLPQIRFRHRVSAAAWDSTRARWSVEVLADGVATEFSCRFLFFCSGYYDYAQGYQPQWPGREGFAGRIVHPQHWPADLDCTGKRVVVIGSGATAVTLLPALAEQAAHVTMLQRSPSYILAVPARDVIGRALQAVLPRKLSYRLIRWKNILIAAALFQFARRRPAAARRWLVRQAQSQSGPAIAPRHLEPRYEPWDQRLCFVPDADLFRALRSGKASIVTDQVEGFTAGGLRRLGRRAAGRHRGDGDRTAAADVRWRPAGGRRASGRGRQVRRVQGNDAGRRAQLRHVHGLHECFLDPALRADRTPGLPHPEPHARARRGRVHAGPRGRRRRDPSCPGPQLRLCATGGGAAAAAGHAQALAHLPELPARPDRPAPGPAARRRAAVCPPWRGAALTACTCSPS